nr:histidine kinase [Xylella fastidiosa subsp. sandyi]
MARTARITCVCFEVHDTGICISSEQQIRLFSSFSQADTSTTRLYESTALGLAWLGLAK